MGPRPRFLIVDGYSPESRAEFDRVGMRLAGNLYAALLLDCVPDAEHYIWYSSDPGAEGISDEALSDYDAVLWPGCNLTIYHDDPRVHAHLDLTRRAFEAGIPGFGSCWAIQLAVYVAGGKVEAHPMGREMGFANSIVLSQAGLEHPMFKGKPRAYSHFVTHDDHVTQMPAEGAVLLSGNDWSPVQAAEVRYKTGLFWGLQYHPEYDLHEMARLILAREAKVLKQGCFRSKEDMHAYVDRLEALHAEPSREDLRWQMRIGDDVLDPAIRRCEFVNFLEHVMGLEVRPQ